MTERSVWVLGSLGVAASLSVSLVMLAATPAVGRAAAYALEDALIQGASSQFAAFDVAGRTPAFVNGSWDALFRAHGR